ncbi:MAG: hypothetical protein HY675_17490 [Chloroflexi bacterium]|nr:hypothetical protein [Chloroflexota bacterium]
MSETVREPVYDTDAQVEEKVRCAYEDLKAILSEKELPPSVRANSIQAISCIWQVMNDLDLEYEMLYDYGA